MVLRSAVLLALLAALPCAAATPETVAREALARVGAAAEIGKVRAAPIAGWLEVELGGEVVYVSTDGRHVLSGRLLDTVAGTDLSERARERLRAERLAAADRDAMIRFEAADARHRITVFTALDCGFCRRFHGELAQYLAQGISVDYVLLPLAGEGSPADRASAGVFCAPDRRTALDEAMLGTSVAGPSCPSSYPAGKALANALGIRTTPTFIAEGGQQLRYSPPADMRAALDRLLAAR